MKSPSEIALALACGRGGCPCAATARNGKGPTHCPCTHAHRNGDASPSFAIAPGDRVGTIFRCHAGCTQEAVVEALRERGLLHAVRDTAGELVALHERKGRWFGADQQISRNGHVKPRTLPLYGSERLLAAPLEPVLIVEGEKARDTAQKALEHAVVLATYGADALPAAEVLETLQLRRVFLWPDNDDPGRRHMQALAAALREIGCEHIRIVDWPDAPDKGDAADYLLAHDANELIQLVKDSKPWIPSPAASEPLVAVPDAAREESSLVPEPGDPMAVARDFFARACWPKGQPPRLLWWRGSFYRWQGTAWGELADAALRKQLYERLEKCSYVGVGRDGKPKQMPWKPTRTKISNVFEALQAVTGLPESTEERDWIEYESEFGWAAGTHGDATHPIAGRTRIIAVADGLFDYSAWELGARGDASHPIATPIFCIHPSTPLFFNLSALPVELKSRITPAIAGDASPHAPTNWLDFLSSLWPDDADSVALLQEWFGYILSGDTHQQKMLLMVGPPRSGKGTIARILGAITGRSASANPTMASLASNFGLAPLIGKTLAVVADARFGGRDVGTAVERLLSISGEDDQTVDRKFKESWTGRLGARFMLLSNELPRFGDVSGAIATRFLILELARSWLHVEDVGLEARLLEELPDILLWALDGLARLRRGGRFTEPESSKDAARVLMDYTSPMRAFVRERCLLGTFHEIPVDEAFGAWRSWCEANGREKPGSAQQFGRDIRAAVPGLRTGKRGSSRGDQQRVFQGFRLRTVTDLEDPADPVRSSSPPSDLGTEIPDA